jgi:hypothetical protein
VNLAGDQVHLALLLARHGARWADAVSAARVVD